MFVVYGVHVMHMHTFQVLHLSTSYFLFHLPFLLVLLCYLLFDHRSPLTDREHLVADGSYINVDIIAVSLIVCRYYCYQTVMFYGLYRQEPVHTVLAIMTEDGSFVALPTTILYSSGPIGCALRCHSKLASFRSVTNQPLARPITRRHKASI